MNTPEAAPTDAAMRIASSEKWWKTTQNPLHVWRVIMICLKSDPPLPLPEWCAAYLATTATNITIMTGGRDFQGDRGRITPRQAVGRVASAMGFSSRGKKNGFLQVAEHSKDIRQLRNAQLGYDAISEIEKERGITYDRARRRLANIKKRDRQG